MKCPSVNLCLAAILFNNLPGKVIKVKTDSNRHWASVVLNINDVSFILFNVYGCKNAPLNNKLLSEMSDSLIELKLVYPTDNIIIGGDFNMVMDEAIDRFPPKFDSSHPNLNLLNFCLKHNIVDAWRARNPNLKQFSWFKPNGNSKLRIDYWLNSYSLIDFIEVISISAAPLTDHCCISISFYSGKRESRNKGYWKFNADLLKHKDFCLQIKSLIKNVELCKDLLSFISKWEYLKHKIREFSIQFSKNVSKARTKLELELTRDLNYLCNKSEMDNETKLQILSLQSKIDDLYIQKAKGAYVSSRARWIEKGEKSNTFFFVGLKRSDRNKMLLIPFTSGVSNSNWLGAIAVTDISLEGHCNIEAQEENTKVLEIYFNS